MSELVVLVLLGLALGCTAATLREYLPVRREIRWMKRNLLDQDVLIVNVHEVPGTGQVLVRLRTRGKWDVYPVEGLSHTGLARVVANMVEARMLSCRSCGRPWSEDFRDGVCVDCSH